jgi:hypothetical protein
MNIYIIVHHLIRRNQFSPFGGLLLWRLQRLSDEFICIRTSHMYVCANISHLEVPEVNFMEGRSGPQIRVRVRFAGLKGLGSRIFFEFVAQE